MWDRLPEYAIHRLTLKLKGDSGNNGYRCNGMTEDLRLSLLGKPGGLLGECREVEVRLETTDYMRRKVKPYVHIRVDGGETGGSDCGWFSCEGSTELTKEQTIALRDFLTEVIRAWPK